MTKHEKKSPWERRRIAERVRREAELALRNGAKDQRTEHETHLEKDKTDASG